MHWLNAAQLMSSVFQELPDNRIRDLPDSGDNSALNAAQLMSSVCRELPDDSPGTPGRPSNSMAATDPVSTEAALSRGLSREECYRSPATARPLRQWQPQPLVCMNAPEIIWRTPRPRGGTLLGVWEPIPK